MFVRSVYENERGDYGAFMKLCIYGPLTRILKVCFSRVSTHRYVSMVCLFIFHCVYGVFMKWVFLCLWCVYEFYIVFI